MSNAHGKPELEATGSRQLTFNVSHVDDVMLVALSKQRRVGIDVDRMRPHLAVDDIAGRFFTQGEIAWLGAIPRDQRDESFLRCWTRKEAVAKAQGIGMATATDHGNAFPDSATAEGKPYLSGVGEAIHWQLADVKPGLDGGMWLMCVSRAVAGT